MSVQLVHYDLAEIEPWPRNKVAGRPAPSYRQGLVHNRHALKRQQTVPVLQDNKTISRRRSKLFGGFAYVGIFILAQTMKEQRALHFFSKARKQSRC
jgi:hypothetical protein